MSHSGKISKTHSSRGASRYQVEIRHDGLNKYQVIRGESEYVVREKASAKMRQWDDLWARKAHADQARAQRAEISQAKDQKQEHARQQTREAAASLQELRGILTASQIITWDALKCHEDYSVPKPLEPKQPQKPVPYTAPEKPIVEGFRPQFGFLDQFIESIRQKKEELARTRFTEALKSWEAAKSRGIATYNASVSSYNASIVKWREEADRALKQWQNEREAYLKQRDEANSAIDIMQQNYLAKQSGAVEDFFDQVLSRSEYPACCPHTYDLEFNEVNGILVVDYDLPAIESLPTIREVKYIVSRDEFQEKHLSTTELNREYDAAIYQIALRTLNELFLADVDKVLAGVVFNGYVNTTDKSTGNEIRPCIISVQTTEQEFCSLRLAAVDPKGCFKKLKGVGSSKLHSIAPIAPLLRMDRDDKRFVAGRSVAETVSIVDNLAAMDWEDFEHLIRELFEKEFASYGGEVKVTRASHDGGVDAIVFDPDPIRGGKIVIQAKRYTNTVGVSAVRDLYGTVHNEGANTGILVTTSDYGPDAYNFAKGKPLKLLNGGELLHLLQKHGHRATIDIAEAKRLQSQSFRPN